MEFMERTRKPIRKIVWAVDPFDKDLILDDTTVRELRDWTDAQQIEIYPVYVFHPISSNEFALIETIEKKIKEFFSERKIPTAYPSVLAQPSFSVSGGAFRLLEHADSLGAGLIVVSSAGRRGLPRLIFGSFAEALLNSSKVPILFLNRNGRPKEASIKKVLWASDFSKGNHSAFQSFLTASNHISDEISLFYDISLSLEVRSYLSALDVVVPSSNEILENREFRARATAQEWLHDAQKHAYKTEPYIGMPPTAVSGGILAAAGQAHAGLIAMGSETSSFEAAIFGSWAREVFRASQYPVWIYGPQFMEEVTKTKRQIAHDSGGAPRHF